MQQIGVLAYVLYCVLRFFMGCFFGGEYAVGHTFAIEYAPQQRRGAVSGFIQSGFPLGYVFASLVFALISLLTAGKAILAQYGWRIAFMTGVIPVFLALCIRRNLQESPEFEKAKATGKIEKSPFLSLFQRPQLWDFLQVFFFMTGLFLTDYSVYGFLPKILTLEGRGFDTTTYSLIYGFALFLSFLGYNFYGWISDRTGRKILTQWYCVFLVVFGVPVYYVLYHAALQRNIWLAILGTCMAGMLKLAWGIVPAYLCERFPTKRRAAGVGFGYSAGAILGAWFRVLCTRGRTRSRSSRHREAGHVAVSGRHSDHRRDHDFRQPAVFSRDQASAAGRSGRERTRTRCGKGSSCRRGGARPG